MTSPFVPGGRVSEGFLLTFGDCYVPSGTPPGRCTVVYSNPDHWGAPGMDVDQVAATRSTLTPLRGSGIGYDSEPVEVPLDGTRRWRIDSKHPKWDTSRPETFRRQPKQFERDSRFGPDWSHVSHDGTLRIGS